MDFALSDEQRIIQQTARTLFTRECSLDLVKRAWDDPAAAQPLWTDHLAQWVALAEQPLTDVTLFVEEHGRAVAPGVYFATLLAAFVAAAAGESLQGSATVAVAGRDGYWIPNGETSRHYVLNAAQVEQVLVVSGDSDSPGLLWVPRDHLSLTEVEQMDRLRPQYRIEVDDQPAGEVIGARAWRRAVQQALVTVSAELVGVGRALLEGALEYAGERQQFGRPIGSFQGLQWKLVDVALELERASAAVAWAAMCVDAVDSQAQQAVHIAKLEAGRAARHCARASLQLHGGIGYTWEHGLHYWLRRAYSGDALMGSSDYHARCLAGLVFEHE